MSQTQKEPMFKVGDSVRVTNRCLPLHLHVGNLIAEDVGCRFLFESDGTNRKGWVSQEDIQGFPLGWKLQKPPQPEPAANIPETPDSSSPVARLVSCLSQGMQNDQDLAWTWHCNIVAASLDEDVDHETANRAAARFMRIAFGVDVTAFDEWIRFDWAKKPPQPEPAANVPENPGSQPWTPKVRETVMSLQTSQMGTVIDIDSNNLEFPYKVDYGHVVITEALSDLAPCTIAGAIQQANVPESPDSSVDDSADANQTVKQIVALTEEDGDEALYVDGVLTACDSTIYACDIAEAAANATVTFSHRNVEQSVSVWPKKLSDVFSANVSDSPTSSVDHSADANKMVEPKIVARYDTEGRDVTELPGLWSEDDTQYRELTEDDRKNLPIKCEVRGSRGQEWYKATLVKFCDNPTHPYIAETDHGKLVQAAHCRIKVAPTVKESLTVDTPDPAKITIGYTVLNAYEPGAEPITEPIERKRVLYLAGPMRGIAFFNYPMFDRVAEILRKAGNEVISPADEDRKHDGFDPFANPEYANPDACVFPKEMDFSKTVRRCLDAVLRCDEIVLLPGWEASNGAVAELTLAMWLGKRVRNLRISDGGYFLWSCYWMGLAGMAVKLRDHHIPEVEAPAPVVVYDEDDDEDILDTAARITRGDRNASYGPPDQDFRRTAGMWSALFGAKLKDGVTFEARDVAMAMILLKCSRESHQRKPDNWVDIAGYARCGSMCN